MVNLGSLSPPLMGIYFPKNKKIKQIGDLEPLMGKPAHEEIVRTLKAEGLAKGIYLRRIWDTFEVRRWIGDETLEAGINVILIFVRNPPNGEPEDTSAAFFFTVKIDKKSGLRITNKKPEEEDGAAPELDASEPSESNPTVTPEGEPTP